MIDDVRRVAERSAVRRLRTSMAVAATVVAAAAGGSDVGPGSGTVSSDKGGFRYADAPTMPVHPLDLTPLTRAVAGEAAKRCATPMAAHPLDVGDAAGFSEKLAGKVAGAAIGRLLGGLVGGGADSGKGKPTLYKDPIDRKLEADFEDAATHAKIELGGAATPNGLLISTHIDKAPGKGTFHAIFLELPDCRRVWPSRYLGYDLWGEWSLSVSVTKTTQSYSDGKLVGESVEHSNWSDSGTFDFSKGISVISYGGPTTAPQLILDPDVAYLDQLQREIGRPVWRQMGFAEPTSGARAVGAEFPIDPTTLPRGTIAVVHVTHVADGRYSTIGFPLTMTAAGGTVTFQPLQQAVAH